jgi:hypothetical protein
MNLKVGLGILVGVTALGTLFIVGSRRSRPDATPAPITAAVPSTQRKPAIAGPVVASALLETPLDALDRKVRLLEEKTKELQARRDRAAAEEKEKELQLRVADARGSAKACTGRWMSEFKLTDAQRGPMHSLFEKWLCEDVARGEYGALDRRTFEARESELRSLLTPEQLQARHDAVRDQIGDVWKSLAISVSRLREGLDPGFLMMGPPWTPASRARADELMRSTEQWRRLAGVDVSTPSPAPDTSLLGDCPAIPDSVLLADAHDLGILGLWRKAEPRVRSLLTADQLEKYAKLLPTLEDPNYHHGY